MSVFHFYILDDSENQLPYLQHLIYRKTTSKLSSKSNFPRENSTQKEIDIHKQNKFYLKCFRQPQPSPACIIKLLCDSMDLPLCSGQAGFTVSCQIQSMLDLDPPVPGTLCPASEALTTKVVRKKRRGTRWGIQMKYFDFTPPLINHKPNPKDNPEHVAHTHCIPPQAHFD